MMPEGVTNQMEAVVVDIVNNHVTVNTAIGKFSGIWCAPTPPCYKKYYLELDCDEILNPHTIRIIDENIPNIRNENGKTSICGYVEEIDEDDVIVLRVYSDIVLLMLENVPDFDYSKYANQFIQAEVSKINLYDIGIC